jgi:hypothetical protein
MNKSQRIVIICAVVVMMLIKLALPPWLGDDNGRKFLGVFGTGSLVLLLGAVAAVSAVLMVLFQTKK